MIIHILVLCNSLADKIPTFQRNTVPLFSIWQTESQQLHPKCQYLSTKLQDTKIRIHNTLKAINLIWSVLQCSLLSIQISEMHLNQHVTHPNTMWPPCSCRIIWGHPMAMAHNTRCCYSPDFTLGWPSWYVTESNRVVLGQIAAATATATAIRFICVTHTDNRLILLQLTLVSYYTYLFKCQEVYVFSRTDKSWEKYLAPASYIIGKVATVWSCPLTSIECHS